jgi:hypothetical protein
MKRIDYTSVDWTRHDAALARELGVTRPAIGKARAKHSNLPSRMPLRDKALTRRDWSKRAHALCAALIEWDNKAELFAENVAPDWLGAIFTEARELHKLKP